VLLAVQCDCVNTTEIIETVHADERRWPTLER
jgi:hypothetical protein